MSLLVWMPLNGDLHNQGLSNITATNNGATVDTNGKIGSCYSFDGSDDFINLGSIGSYFDGSAFSICFWIFSLEDKTRAAVFSSYGLSSTSNFFGLEINSSNNNYCNNNLRFDWLSSDTYSPDNFVTYNTWTHICVTYDGVNQIKMYKNGELIQTSTRVLNAIPIGNTYYLGRDSRTGSTAFKGKMNDFRIYDTALSPREIKEISKGLVLHYPLSCVGQKNYINTVTIASVPSNGSTSIIEDGVKTNGLNKDTYFVIKLNTNLVAGTTYTLSFYAEGMTDGSALNFGLGAQSPSSTQYCGLVMVHNGFNTHVFTPNVAFSGQIIMDDTNRNGLPIVNMKYFKIEEGDIATPWCVSENDPRYTIMGMSDNIEYDVSGYSHNGTKTNTEFSSDTPRNIGSLYFDGTSFIQTNPLPSEVKTISVWCKTTKNKSTSQFICQDSASGLCVTFYNGSIITHLGSGYSTGSKCILGDSYIENGWNHFVVLKTGTHTRDVYCNGVKLTPTSNDYWSPTTGFLVGARNMSNGLPFYGYISDLRAYTTLLSEEDILELYHTPISLTSDGTLLTQGEYVES